MFPTLFYTWFVWRRVTPVYVKLVAKAFQKEKKAIRAIFYNNRINVIIIGAHAPRILQQTPGAYFKPI